MPDASVILDTCALLWLVGGDRKLTPKAKRAIDAAPVAYVSAISAWEIGLKAVRGELDLPLTPREWFDAAIVSHNLTLASLDVDILMFANDLPWHHRDPADRFIIATARRLKLTVVTTDARFAAYGVAVVC